MNYLNIEYKKYIPANFWLIHYFTDNPNLLVDIFLDNTNADFKS